MMNQCLKNWRSHLPVYVVFIRSMHGARRLTRQKRAASYTGLDKAFSREPYGGLRARTHA